jgi:hypothetical protein
VISSCRDPILIAYESSKIKVLEMKLVVTPEAVKNVKPGSMLFAACVKDAAIILEHCTFEVATDSPELMNLTPFTVACGAQVCKLKLV